MDFKINEYPHLQFGTLFCIGRNYAKHVEEMNSKQTDDPVVFLKPRSSIIRSGESILLPNQSENVHHEVELVALIGKETKNIDHEHALKSVKALAVGLDLTARDLQSTAKKSGLPWTLSKGFNTFAPIGNFFEYDESIDVQNLDISVSVNGVNRQSSNTSMMLFNLETIIHYLSTRFVLYPGDLIFTGTPEGVSRIVPGDRIRAALGNNLSTLEVYVK
ncbi:MAG: fumarylacetoacetate hydrolase family protein [Balneolaceae bacterium]